MVDHQNNSFLLNSLFYEKAVVREEFISNRIKNEQEK